MKMDLFVCFFLNARHNSAGGDGKVFSTPVEKILFCRKILFYSVEIDGPSLCNCPSCL